MPQKPRSRPSARSSRKFERPPPSVEILDIAFRRASLANPHGKTKPERDRRRAQLKIIRSAATVLRQVHSEIRPYRRPGLTDFEAAMVSSRFGEGTLERSLARLARSEERIRTLQRETDRLVSHANGPEEIGTEVKRFYGRLSSHVREVDPDLVRIREIRGFLRDRPQLDPAVPTLVVAGFPNVGKSSLVAKLSSARPKVDDYPFTTVSIEVGHADLGFDRWQVLDTPGVLDRNLRTNRSESEAQTAVEQVARVILFVFDPSESSGHSLVEQERLLARWKAELPGRPIVEVETKADLVRRPASGRLAVSARTGEGLEELWQAIALAAGSSPPEQPGAGAEGESPGDYGIEIVPARERPGKTP